MRTFAKCFMLLTALIYRETQGQVIIEPDDVTVCEGRSTTFTCALDSSISSDDVQWYRLLKDTGTTVMADPQGSNIHLTTSTINNTLTSNLTITNARRSYTGYYWVRLSSDDVCNVSLTVTTSPSALTVNIMKNTDHLSILVQWDEVDDSLHTIYTITWHSERDLNNVQVKSLEEQSSYTITGLTLDTVYTITVTAVNKCGFGPEYSTIVSLTSDTTSTTSSIIRPTSSISTNSMTISSTEDPTTSSTVVTSTTTAATTTTTHVATTTSSSIAGISTINNPTTTTTTVTTTTTTKSSSTTITNPGTTATTISTVVPPTATAGPRNPAGATSNCTCDEGSDSSGLSTGAVVVITFTVTFIVSVTATAIITFIVAYVCVKRTLTKANNVINVHNPSESSPQEKVLYEQVCISSKTVTKNDLELQPNPAYGTSCKIAMDTNPAYESCK